MRLISIMTGAAVLASCTTGPPVPASRSAENQHAYEQLLVGKVAEAPISCLPHYRADDMRVIDDETIAFKDGSSRTYVTHMLGGCNNLAGGHYALVTKKYGTADTCRGDIAEVVDTLNRMTVGSCVFGDFTPYVRPRV
jgi:hypothetical protein